MDDGDEPRRRLAEVRAEQASHERTVAQELRDEAANLATQTHDLKNLLLKYPSWTQLEERLVEVESDLRGEQERRDEAAKEARGERARSRRRVTVAAGVAVLALLLLLLWQWQRADARDAALLRSACLARAELASVVAEIFDTAETPDPVRAAQLERAAARLEGIADTAC